MYNIYTIVASLSNKKNKKPNIINKDLDVKLTLSYNLIMLYINNLINMDQVNNRLMYKSEITLATY